MSSLLPQKLNASLGEKRRPRSASRPTSLSQIRKLKTLPFRLLASLQFQKSKSSNQFPRHGPFFQAVHTFLISRTMNVNGRIRRGTHFPWLVSSSRRYVTIFSSLYLRLRHFLFQDQDSWAGGSAGSTAPGKCPSVIPLDGEKCQVADHICQGVYHCSQLDMSLLESCQRYEPDTDKMRELFEAERVVNIEDTSAAHQRAAA